MGLLAAMLIFRLFKLDCSKHNSLSIESLSELMEWMNVSSSSKRKTCYNYEAWLIHAKLMILGGYLRARGTLKSIISQFIDGI